MRISQIWKHTFSRSFGNVSKMHFKNGLDVYIHVNQLFHTGTVLFFQFEYKTIRRSRFFYFEKCINPSTAPYKIMNVYKIVSLKWDTFF